MAVVSESISKHSPSGEGSALSRNSMGGRAGLKRIGEDVSAVGGRERSHAKCTEVADIRKPG